MNPYTNKQPNMDSSNSVAKMDVLENAVFET